MLIDDVDEEKDLTELKDCSVFLSDDFVLTRSENNKLRKRTAKEVYEKLLVNQEIDKLCPISPKRLSAQRPRYHEHAFILTILRDADKLALKKKEEQENAKMSLIQKTGKYLRNRLKKSMKRFVEYSVNTAKAYIPIITVSDNSLNDAIVA